MDLILVKQPNGLFARRVTVNTVTYSFSHMNMTEVQAMEVCEKDTSRQEARILIDKAKSSGLKGWELALSPFYKVPGIPMKMLR